MNIRRYFLLSLLILGIVSCSQSSITQNQNTSTPTNTITKEKTPLVVFGAGSLIIPFNNLEKAFEARYPHIDVQAEYHGSIQVIRHVSELHHPIDVVATADAALIPMLMYQVTNPDTNLPYANWHIRFASNRLAVAYTDKSLYAQNNEQQNWQILLTKPDLKVGIADPRFDPSGYRTFMAYALAQYLYGDYSLFSEMFNNQFARPVTVFLDDRGALITVPEILESQPGARVVIRGASIQLISLLQSGDLDYAFEYESVIQQHGLNMLALPDEVNLGNELFEDLYNQVQVNLDFRRFASVKPIFRGERIGYGVTIPSNAPHPDEAALFIEFLLGPEGSKIMNTDYHPMFDEPLGNQYDNIPALLQPLCIPEPSS